jgi:diguanylate cyclase (GGDEF)-like protein
MRILVAEDEDTLRTVITEVLETDGHEVVGAASGEAALEIFRRTPFSLVLTDIVMGRLTGLDLLSEIKLIDPGSLVVVMTSHASLDSATAALRSGAYDFLTKPFEDLDAITTVVNRAIDKIRLVETNNVFLEELKNKTDELEKLNTSLRDMANKDGLTGLFNHRYFREYLDREASRATRHGRLFSLVMFDVDYFKRFNDSFGHLAGDEALRRVAGVLRSSCRASSVLARYGGEEFVTLLPETDKRGAVILAERVRAGVEVARFVGTGPPAAEVLTMSCGVSTCDEDGADATTLLEAADRALYRAKAEGRNTTRAAPGTAVSRPETS